VDDSLDISQNEYLLKNIPRISSIKCKNLCGRLGPLAPLFRRPSGYLITDKSEFSIYIEESIKGVLNHNF